MTYAKNETLDKIKAFPAFLKLQVTIGKISKLSKKPSLRAEEKPEMGALEFQMFRVRWVSRILTELSMKPVGTKPGDLPPLLPPRWEVRRDQNLKFYLKGISTHMPYFDLRVVIISLILFVSYLLDNLW